MRGLIAWYAWCTRLETEQARNSQQFWFANGIKFSAAGHLQLASECLRFSREARALSWLVRA